MIAVAWDISGAAAVVVGGGFVGRRKVQTLQEAGASVTVIDPVGPEFPSPVKVLAEGYRTGHLVGYNFAVAAGPPPVNAAVVRDARAAGMMVCSASDPASGTFTFPAVARRGRVTVAVHTGGAGPAFAKELLARAAAALPDGIAAHADLLREVRALVLRTVPDPRRRAALLRAAAALGRVGFAGSAEEFLTALATPGDPSTP